MRILVILDVDPEQVIESRIKSQFDDWESLSEEEQAKLIAEFDGTIAGAVEEELGWVDESGIDVHLVFEPDDIDPNDATFGANIRKELQ